LTLASKVLLRVLTNRLQAKVEADGCLGEDQFGFRKGTGTRDQRRQSVFRSGGSLIRSKKFSIRTEKNSDFQE